MKTKIFSGLFILALLAIGCVSEFNASLPSNEKQILVVEGNIIENSNATFYISKSYPMDSSSVPPEIFDIEAKVTIIGSNGYKSAPAIDQGKGAYSINVGQLDDNVKYGIQIEYDGETYQSALSKPLHTPEIDSVSWIQPEAAGTISFRVSTHDDNTGEASFFMWNYVETWEFSAYYNTTIFLDPTTNSFYTASPAPYYFCWRNNVSNNSYLIGSTESLTKNTIINQKIFQGDAGDERFSILYSVLVYQKAISKAAFDFYQNKIKLNEEMGGLFSPQPSELGGNITCITNASQKVTGYVEVIKNVTQKRIFVDRNQISRPHIVPPDCPLISNDDVLSKLANTQGVYSDFYNLGYRPAGYANPRHPNIPDNWAYVFCTDCTYNRGGSKDRPDFWPNDDK